MSLPVCKFYSYNRNCKFGTNCRFLHSISQRPPLHSSNNDGKSISNQECHTSSSFQDISETNYQESNHEVTVNQPTPTDLPESDSIRVNPSQNENRNIISLQDRNTQQPRKVCRYFVQHGKCAFGRNCRFLHNASDPKLHHARQAPPRFQKKSETSSRREDIETERNEDEIFIQTPLKDDLLLVKNFHHDNEEECAQHIAGIELDERRGASNGPRVRESSRRLCRYFKSGYCSNGRNCKFSHSLPGPMHPKGKSQLSLHESKDEGQMPSHLQQRHPEKPQAIVKPMPQVRSRANRPSGPFQQVIQLSAIELDGTQKYRQFDISFLQKRFQDWRAAKDTAVNELDDFTIDLVFAPSDPDWPFDVSSYNLQLTLPKNYPKEIMIVKVPTDEQDLPESVRRYLEVSMVEWLSERGARFLKDKKVELVVRPFFRWLDRNFEDLMTEALKQLKRELTARAAGMEFIPANQLKAKYNAIAQSADVENSETEESADSQLEDDDDSSSDECLESEDETDSSSEDDEERQSLSLDADRKGTEIKLCNLQFKQNASSLLFEKLRLIVQCSRCKNHTEVSVVRGKVMSLTCNQCSFEMLVQFRPTLAHQFSSVAGYLDLDSCLAFDLILQECTVIISCLACSKMTKINGMVSGQLIDGWCQACNARFKFATESIKFNHLEPSSVDTGDKGRIEVVHSKKKKPPKEAGIKEGYPLPDFGACRHYKQSYRWLRFPCCGKAYPCDICHDKKEDHEMTVANRMICGHCCKEQNYSGSRPCNSCSQHLTKVHSAHWEGGTGCRNKIAMSKSDQQKYRDMNKTVSNHKKKVQDAGSKKKKTKLRHS